MNRDAIPDRRKAERPPAAGDAAPRVMLVVADPGRLAGLSERVRRLAPACRLHTGLDAIEALLGATRMLPDLVLIDAALPMGHAPALARQLTHLVAGATVMIFDEAPTAAPAAPYVGTWDDVHALLTGLARSSIHAAARTTGAENR